MCLYSYAVSGNEKVIFKTIFAQSDNYFSYLTSTSELTVDESPVVLFAHCHCC